MNTAKVGLLGGTFDPVHLGHIQLAEAALVEYGLDEIVFLPAAEPPHKLGNPITPFHHRLAMLELVCTIHLQFSVSSIEEQLPKPSYTIDTLRSLKASSNAKYYFIIGEDAFCEIHTWREYEEILKSISFIVAKRKGHYGDLEQYLEKLGFQKIEEYKYIGKQNRSMVLLMRSIPVSCSATEIKNGLHCGLKNIDCLPENVLAYINRQGLYQEKLKYPLTNDDHDRTTERQQKKHLCSRSQLAIANKK